MRSQLRTVIVVGLTTLVIAFTAPDLVLPWHPFANYGMTEAVTSRTTATVTSVTPGGSAAQAGVRVGDIIDFAAMLPQDRRSIFMIYNAERDGVAATFAFVHGASLKHVTLVSKLHARTLADNASDVVLILSQIAFGIIVMALVLLRPGVLTWAFFIYGLSAVDGSVTAEALAPTPLQVAQSAWFNVLPIAGLVAFIIFALRFPSNTLTRWKRFTERDVLWLSPPLLLAALYGGIGPSLLLPGAVSVSTIVYDAIVPLGYLVGVLAFVATLLHATPQERPRVVWVVCGFILGYGGFGIYNALFTSGVFIPIWLTNILQTSNILVPITVMYAILKHRVIDIRFFLNRALVYGLLTSVGVGLLILLDWAVAKRLESFGVVVEVAGALGLGLAIQRLHTFIDALVDRYVFRSVHEAERHLERVGNAMMYADSLHALDRLIVEESARALRLSSVAVFRRESDAFSRARAAGWTEREAQDLDVDDPLILDLQAQKRGVTAGPFLSGRADFPHGAAAPAFAVPMCVRQDMTGFALFGAHVNASDIDPNEQAVLERFMQRAAVAYDHVTNAERAEENTRLRIELDFLRGLVTAPATKELT